MSSLLTRILVATDGSEGRPYLTVCAAADLSGRAGAELYLVYVRRRLPVMEGLPQSAHFERAVAEYVASYEEETGQLMRRQVFRAKAERADVAGTHLREGRPAVEIVDVAEDLDTDLVVVGSRGFGTVKRLVLGSVSERVASSGPCPVLVARGSWPPTRGRWCATIPPKGQEEPENWRRPSGGCSTRGRLLVAPAAGSAQGLRRFHRHGNVRGALRKRLRVPSGASRPAGAPTRCAS